MSDDVESVTHETLRSIQAGIAQRRTETSARFDRLEAGMRKDRRDAADLLVMMRATAGDFDERVAALENRAG